MDDSEYEELTSSLTPHESAGGVTTYRNTVSIACPACGDPFDDLVICGTLANVCVLHTSGSAGLRDFRPVLVTDALGYIEADHLAYATEHVDWLFGETVEREAIEFAPATAAGE